MIELSCSGILFDSDGVLVDTNDVITAGWRRLSEEYPAVPVFSPLQLHGKRAVELLTPYVEREQLSRAVARIEELEIELASQTRALDGATELLDALGEARWAVVTSGQRAVSQVRWRNAGIPQPPVSVTAEDVPVGKPSPDPYLKAAALLGVEPEECMVFEDSPSGAVSARAAGATVVAVGRVEWPYEPAARVADLTRVRVEDTTRSTILSFSG